MFENGVVFQAHWQSELDRIWSLGLVCEYECKWSSIFIWWHKVQMSWRLQPINGCAKEVQCRGCTQSLSLSLGLWIPAVSNQSKSQRSVESPTASPAAHFLADIHQTTFYITGTVSSPQIFTHIKWWEWTEKPWRCWAESQWQTHLTLMRIACSLNHLNTIFHLRIISIMQLVIS